MTKTIWKIRSAFQTVVSIVTLISLISCSFVLAAEIPLGGNGGSQDIMTISQTIGSEDYSPLPIVSKEEISPQNLSDISSSGKIGVTISKNTITFNKQKINLIAGYITGDLVGLKISIQGAKTSDSKFQDITTLHSDENGIFIWALEPEQKDLNFFRVSVQSGLTQVQSKTVGFSSATEDPIVQPAIIPTLAVQTMDSTHFQVINQTSSNDSTIPSMSNLIISASSMTPAVGDLLIISGKLSDKDGKGIGGATVTIDETGYPGADTGSPFVTVQTASDGSFDTQLGVSAADTVGLVAKFKGDGNHSSAESNTITFTAHA